MRKSGIRKSGIRDQGSGISDQGIRGQKIRNVELIPDTCLLIPKTGTTTSEGARSSGVA
jgi:hypothetical protein